ncbi:MAG: hypothetical protein QME75_03630 [Deltaproteobacteria bacterium]|nr:hypothetical protein [Deltaproteobacteria bacterium]
MNQRKSAMLAPAILLILFTFLATGCLGEPALQQEVTTEYLLSSAGFQKWEVNEKTPARQALLDALPPGQISVYRRDGQVYHAYPDTVQKFIYVGDEAAYQRYQSLAQGRKMCRLVTGANQVQFWSCMDDYRQTGAGAVGR